MYTIAAMIINKVITTNTTTTIVVVLLSPSDFCDVVGLKPLVVVNSVEYFAANNLHMVEFILFDVL